MSLLDAIGGSDESFDRFSDDLARTITASRAGEMEPAAVPAAVLRRLARGDENEHVARESNSVARYRLEALTMLTEIEWAVTGRAREGYRYKPYEDGSIGSRALRRDVFHDGGLPGVRSERTWTTHGGGYSRLVVEDVDALDAACERLGVDEDLRLHVDGVVAEYGLLEYHQLLRTADIYVDVDWSDVDAV